jgi:hypothetical protein
MVIRNNGVCSRGTWSDNVLTSTLEFVKCRLDMSP